MSEVIEVATATTAVVSDATTEVLETSTQTVLIENAGTGPQGPASSTEELALEVQADANDSHLTYVGKAAIGSSTAAPVWQIARLDDTSGLVKTWADGNAAFDNIFDNRESLNYS